MSDNTSARPSQVTMAGWTVIVGSVLVVVTVFDQVSSLHTVEVREAFQQALSEPMARNLGVTVDQVLVTVRVLSSIVAACAAATAILGWHVLRRHKPSRLALTVLAVPLFVCGIISGGFFTAFVAAGAMMLWSKPARAWFDGAQNADKQSG